MLETGLRIKGVVPNSGQGMARKTSSTAEKRTANVAAWTLPVADAQAVTPVALRLDNYVGHRPRHAQQSHALSRNKATPQRSRSHNAGMQHHAPGISQLQLIGRDPLLLRGYAHIAASACSTFALASYMSSARSAALCRPHLVNLLLAHHKCEVVYLRVEARPTGHQSRT